MQVRRSEGHSRHPLGTLAKNIIVLTEIAFCPLAILKLYYFSDTGLLTQGLTLATAPLRGAFPSSSRHFYRKSLPFLLKTRYVPHMLMSQVSQHLSQILSCRCSSSGDSTLCYPGVGVKMEQQDVTDWLSPLALLFSAKWHHYLGFYLSLLCN